MLNNSENLILSLLIFFPPPLYRPSGFKGEWKGVPLILFFSPSLSWSRDLGSSIHILGTGECRRRYDDIQTGYFHMNGFFITKEAVKHFCRGLSVGKFRCLIFLIAMKLVHTFLQGCLCTQQLDLLRWIWRELPVLYCMSTLQKNTHGWPLSANPHSQVSGCKAVKLHCSHSRSSWKLGSEIPAQSQTFTLQFNSTAAWAAAGACRAMGQLRVFHCSIEIPLMFYVSSCATRVTSLCCHG